VLVHDAQLLAEELPTEAEFGHACAEYAGVGAEGMTIQL